MSVKIRVTSPVLYICPYCKSGFTAEEGFAFAERHVKTHARGSRGSGGGSTRRVRKKAPSFDTFLDSLSVGYNDSESVAAG